MSTAIPGGGGPLRCIRFREPVAYRTALAMQRQAREQRIRGDLGDTLYLLEHPPVITLGRNADPAGIVASPARLRRLGIPVERVERGGQATYHGPGQLVGYPILGLRPLGLGVGDYVRRLEEVLLRMLAVWGVAAARRPGSPGVYCGRRKIGALGVAVSRGVTLHGFALNLEPDLGHFELIVPCGLIDTPATSVAAETARPAPSLETAQDLAARTFAAVFGVEIEAGSVRRAFEMGRS